MRSLSRLRTGVFTAGRWVVVAAPPGKEHTQARFVQLPLPATQFLQLETISMFDCVKADGSVIKSEPKDSLQTCWSVFHCAQENRNISEFCEISSYQLRQGFFFAATHDWKCCTTFSNSVSTLPKKETTGSFICP